MSLPYFNSIKVQLEHSKTLTDNIEHYFNSIKVQLEPLMRLTLKPFLIFQFHKGTIRTVVEIESSLH